MDTSRVDGVKAPQHRGTPRSHLGLAYSSSVLELDVPYVPEHQKVRVVAYYQSFPSAGVDGHALISFFGALEEREFPPFRRVEASQAGLKNS